MNILLTHGYFVQDDPKERVIMKPYPPLGMLYVSAFLEQEGLDNTVFDTTFSSKDEQRAFLLEHRPRYLAIYVNLMTKINVLELITWIRSQQALEGMNIILGGPDVRYNATHLIDHGADFLVIGEGEQTCTELIQYLEDGKRDELKDVQGLCFKDAAGEVVQTAERTKIKAINELPLPNRSKIRIEDYLHAWKSHHGESALSVSTMRGCPYTCKWCSRAVYGLSYRRRSVEQVADELEIIQREYAPDTIWFVDDVFTVSHKWLTAFRDELQKRNLSVKYECITRADRMNEEVIDLLVESGCFRVWIGAESGSQKVIDLMDRRVDVNKVRDMIKLSRQKGIQAGTFIMLGYPGETEEDIEETIHHLKTSNPDYFTITVAYPIRGTELFQEIEAVQTTNLDWTTSTDRDIDFQRTYPRRYYDFAVRRVTNEVNYFKRSQQDGALSLPALNHKARSMAAKMGMWWHRSRSSR